MKTTTTLLKLCFAMFILLASSNNILADDDFSGLFCPSDVYVDCDEELWDLSIYGNAYYKDYGGTHDAGQPYVKYHLNSCNTGYITRTWSVRIYGINYSCSQTIHVGGSGDIGYNDIHWPPKHVDLSGCSPNTDPYSSYDGYPQWNYNDCSLLAMSYRDSYFKINGTCNKIIREWTVLDWCVYDPYYNPGTGVYKYFQTIKIADDDIPEYTCPEDIDVNSYNCEDADVVADPLIIDPSMCGGEFTITNDSPYADANGNDLSGTYPIGKTTVKYTIKYGCGEIETCKVEVRVNDAKAPTPYCYAYMAISLMGIDNDEDGLNDEGMAEVWAQDLDAGSYAHCVEGPLKFSFSSDTKDNVRIFTCNEVGENTVQMWVTDALGNQSWCIVTLDVQNNAAAIQDCLPAEDQADDEESDMLTLQGKVSTVFGEVVPGVEIMMADLDVDMVISTRMDTSYLTTNDTVFKDDGSMLIRHLEETLIEEVSDTVINLKSEYEMTNTDGQYTFAEMAYPEASYKVEVMGSEEPDFEVEIEDLEVLFDHLTRVEPFTSPYQYIAADVDGDGTVAFMDLRHMLMLYSGKTKSLPSDIRVVYLDASVTFDHPEDVLTEEYKDFIEVTDITNDISGLDFTKINIGDLSAPQNLRQPDNSRSRKLSLDVIATTSDLELIHEVEKLLSIAMEDVPAVYPNPFEDRVRLSYRSDVSQQSVIRIYSVDGRLIKTLGQEMEKGMNFIDIDLKDNEGGLYFYTLNTGGKTHSGKLIKR